MLDIPYEIYLHTGDKAILAAYLEPMERWMRFLEARANGTFLIDKIFEGWPHIGDWLWPGHHHVKPGTAWTSPVESEALPKSYFNSCLYAHAVGRLVEILQILGKDASSYVALKANIDRAIRNKWFDPKTHTFATAQHGAEALALWAGILPPEQQQAVANAMARHIVEDCDGHLDTGMYSTLRLLAMLTRYGHEDVAAGIMRKTTYPSFGFMLRNGHTTLLEYYEGIRNHNMPIFATYGEWMLTDVLGIRPDLQKPGYRNIILSPMLLDELTWVQGRLQTPRGMVQVRWERSPAQVLLRAQIPLGSTAQVRVPPKLQRVTLDGARVRTFDKDRGRWVQIEAGERTVAFRSA
jgi:alpha-L-rhamnosidase